MVGDAMRERRGIHGDGGAAAALAVVFGHHFLRSLGPMYRSDLSGPAARMPLSDWLNVGRATIWPMPAVDPKSGVSEEPMGRMRGGGDQSEQGNTHSC